MCLSLVRPLRRSLADLNRKPRGRSSPEVGSSPSGLYSRCDSCIAHVVPWVASAYYSKLPNFGGDGGKV